MKSEAKSFFRNSIMGFPRFYRRSHMRRRKTRWNGSLRWGRFARKQFALLCFAPGRAHRKVQQQAQRQQIGLAGRSAPHPEANHLGMGFFLAISVGVIEQLVKVKS